MKFINKISTVVKKNFHCHISSLLILGYGKQHESDAHSFAKHLAAFHFSIFIPHLFFTQDLQKAKHPFQM